MKHYFQGLSAVAMNAKFGWEDYNLNKKRRAATYIALATTDAGLEPILPFNTLHECSGKITI